MIPQIAGRHGAEAAGGPTARTAEEPEVHRPTRQGETSRFRVLWWYQC